MKLLIAAHNYLPWPVARRLVRIADFGDGTFALSWRYGKTWWCVS